MLHALVHALLIAAIVACPIACDAGFCCRADDRASGADAGVEQKACCPACRHKSDAPRERSQPRPAKERPCDDKCQGICGGAVIESHVELQLNSLQALDVISIATPPAIVEAAETCSLVEAPPPCGRPCSGRAVRILHSSLLC